MTSIWTVGGSTSVGHPPLSGRLSVDVAVVGGGITGLTTALLLREAGHKVAILEADRIGCGNTGGSTGNLYGTVSSGLAPLGRKWKADVLRQVVGMRMEALDYIEETIARHSINCSFNRCSLHEIVAADAAQGQALEDEYSAARDAGLEARLVDEVPGLPFPIRRALRIDGQAQFNPLHYARALAEIVSRMGVLVHEGSVVTDLDAGDGRITTTQGEVLADHVVFATHTPKGFNLVQAEMLPYRECGIAAPSGSGACPDGILWVRDEGQSLRRHREGNQEFVVAVGEKHKTGHDQDGQARFDRMREYMQRRFGLDRVSHQWSAQQYAPADGLPYIGRSLHHNVLMATGFSADGLTWGTVAAHVIVDLVRDRETAAGQLLSPRRFTPVKSAKVWAEENAEVMRHMVGDRLRAADLEQLSALQPGEGRIVDIDGTRHAAHRSLAGELTVLSPVCPHMGCHVAWNAAETSWDCPCHGSRFRTDGSVIEGPALKPLQAREVPEQQEAGRKRA